LIDEAVTLAGEPGAKLEVFGVFDPVAHVNGFEPSRLLLDEVLPRARARALADLEAAALTARAGGADCDARLADGDLPDLPQAILRRAAEWGADLVVMGTHGRTGVDRVLQGSVAERLLRLASVPVLLVRVPDSA
jgi:nucleotide-binding universal stress UspA family protein